MGVHDGLVGVVVDAGAEVGHGAEVDEAEGCIGLAQDDVGRLHVAVHEADGVQLLQGTHGTCEGSAVLMMTAISAIEYRGCRRTSTLWRR